MKIEFKFGPKDGYQCFIPLGKLSKVIIVVWNDDDHLYAKTGRHTLDGHTVYQYIGLIKDSVAA